VALSLFQATAEQEFAEQHNALLRVSKQSEFFTIPEPESPLFEPPSER